jgi:16S rRNA (cytidine1402-2'-O)-methyltransferase
MSNLYIVATPIGNLDDITFRAIQTLGQVDLIACEDTRHTKILLDYYNIQTKTVSYHQHSKITKINFLISELRAGKNIALVSDAGTPAISDPGTVLVKQVILELSESVKIIPIPGASALASAISISGLPSDNFLFLGFLPHKKGKQTILKKIIEEKGTYIFYESCHRILKTLEQLKNLEGSASLQIVVCRELTKKFETIYRGNVEQILSVLSGDDNNTRGEFVVVVRQNF